MRAPESVRVVQAAMVRLSVDPGFVEAVYGGDRVVFELGEGPRVLTESERAMLTAVDRRAWGTDRFRRARLVQALIDEYTVTAAVVGVAPFDVFFSSEAFGRVLTQRGSMAVDVAHFLGERLSGAAFALSQLEGAVARARRRFEPEGLGLVAAAGVVGVSLPEGTLEAWSQGRAALGAQPVAAVVRGARWTPPALGRREVPLLIECGADGQVGVSPASGGLVGLVEYCRTPRKREQVRKRARRLGASRKAAGSVVQGLVDDGLLVERT